MYSSSWHKIHYNESLLSTSSRSSHKSTDKACSLLCIAECATDKRIDLKTEANAMIA